MANVTIGGKYSNAGEYIRLRSLERDLEREWWCFELLGDLDDSIFTVFLLDDGKTVLGKPNDSLSLTEKHLLSGGKNG